MNRLREISLPRLLILAICLLVVCRYCYTTHAQSTSTDALIKRQAKVQQSLWQLNLAFVKFQNPYYLPDIKKHPEYYDQQGDLKLSWRVHLLPYLGKQNLYDRFKLDESWDSPANAPLAKQMPDVYRSPDSPLATNRTRFRGFQGSWITNTEGNKVPTSIFAAGQTTQPRDITDGMSNTLLILETGPDQAVVWTNPEELSFTNPVKASGPPSTERMALFCDGTVRLMNPNMGDEIWQKLIQPADGSDPDLNKTALRYIRPAPKPRTLTMKQKKFQQDSRRRMLKVNDLRIIGLAMIQFESVYGRISPTENQLVDGKALLSWRVHILPFLGEQELYKEFHTNEPWDSPHNKTLLNKMPKVFKSDGVKQDGYTTYMTFTGKGTPFSGGLGPKLEDFKDGLSKTILFVSAGPSKAVPWTRPVDLPLVPQNPAKVIGIQSDDFLQILLADGSVKRIPSSITPETLKHLIQIDDGNDINWDELK
ncbi:DUF1559 family PulG-like putative transporter [Gimesia algae]|uniref:DUF1559 domain-containing protein n=1 Tax=Gimesia algae TaxID=2527971 RepID=A0A517VGN4_9PLAN|nr:DUF1559 domain-containing protein [Gimesia algae]QDT92164.1 hypothetical protein Pan161_38310 [Gimesia algae]